MSFDPLGSRVEFCGRQVFANALDQLHKNRRVDIGFRSQRTRKRGGLPNLDAAARTHRAEIQTDPNTAAATPANLTKRRLSIFSPDPD